MLLREQRRRHEHGDLPAAGDRGERGPKRNFGLAEADVAADHAVHRLAGAHVGQHGLDRLVLVDRLLERERGLEGAIGVFVERERPAFACRAARVEIEQFRGDVAHALGRAAPGARPLLGAELVPGRRFGRAAGIAGDAVERVHRHVQQIAAGVLQHQELRRVAGDLHDLQAAVAADAVVLVYHRRAGRERGELAQDRLGIALGPAAPAFLAGALAEELFLGDQRERAIRQQEAAHVGGHGEPERAPAREKSRPVGHHVHREALAAQHVEQHFASAGRVGGHQRAAGESREERGELLERLRPRLSPRSSGGGPEAKFSNGSVAPIGSTLTAVRSTRGCRPMAASASPGGTKDSAGGSSGRSRSCRRSSYRASISLP